MLPPELRRNVATGGWLSATPPRFRDAVLDRAVVRRYGPREVLHEAGDRFSAHADAINNGRASLFGD